MFKDIPTVPELPEYEKQIIDYWKTINVVELLKKERAGADERVYYDGPITANGEPHYGHAIQWTLKDLIPRYWSMNGFFVSRNMGWDCQGIPVEFEVEKRLGFEKKDDIEKYGVVKFNDLCRNSVFEYKDAIYNYETRIGRWFDETDMYYTMDKDYIESMWWSLKELYKKGYLYEGHKVVAYSTRAGCTLSTHEVDNGGYKEIEDPTVTVEFKVKSMPDTYFLAWTTTPWTMPGNLLLAVGKDIAYVLVRGTDPTKKYIVASSCLEKVFGQNGYQVIEQFTADQLIGLEYEPPYDLFEEKRAEGCFKVTSTDFVGTDEGTGIVHLAPYGAEDFEVFMSFNIPLFDYLDEEARFTTLVPAYQGLFYKEANPKIIADLQTKDLLFNHSTIKHRMPMCWRTDTPLIYKPIKSWYFASTKLRDRLLEANEEINWIPESMKESRVGTWIKIARDWALSRRRYWGTPIPVWVNDKTGEKVFIGSFKELQDLSGKELVDPHKPFVDEITWEDPQNGGTFHRIADVLDVWYDSGAMPFAQHHYPFENQELFDKKYPAEYIAEMYEQTRLWYYTMLIINLALFDKIPYKNAACHGIFLDNEGKKFSKRKGNYPPFGDVLDTFGGDILRYFILTTPVVYGEAVVFGDTGVLVDARKQFFNPLWNSVKFFITFANLHNFNPSEDKSVTNELPIVTNELDKWILVRLQDTINQVVQNMDKYLVMEATRTLYPFVSDLSTWYIRRSRDRIKSGDLDALKTLYYVLTTFTRLIAPMLPFISEKLYEILDLRAQREKASVHVDLYPAVISLSKVDQDLLDKMQKTRLVVSTALAIRAGENIKVRQPLAIIYINENSVAASDCFTDLIMDEINVKDLRIVAASEFEQLPQVQAQLDKYMTTSASGDIIYVYLDTTITPDLLLEGQLREFIRKIQDMRKEQSLSVYDRIKVVCPKTPENEALLHKFDAIIKNKVIAESITFGDNYKISKV